MKLSPLISFIIIIIHLTCKNKTPSSGKEEDLLPPNKEYIQKIYNPETKTYNTSYNYSNKWDIDGDGKKDALFFIGDNGAHTHFFPRIILSSDKIVRDFPYIKLDMPYIVEDMKNINKDHYPEFVTYDFDDDGIVELYFNISYLKNSLPVELRNLGIKSKRFLMDFNNKKFEIKDVQRVPVKFP